MGMTRSFFPRSPTSKKHSQKKDDPRKEMPPKAKKQVPPPPSPDICGLVEYAAFHNHAGLIEGKINPREDSCNCSNPSTIIVFLVGVIATFFQFYPTFAIVFSLFGLPCHEFD